MYTKGNAHVFPNRLSDNWFCILKLIITSYYTVGYIRACFTNDEVLMKNTRTRLLTRESLMADSISCLKTSRPV